MKLACEGLLQEPPDTGLAAEILAAADLRCPRGALGEVYDRQGNLYSVPRFCYSAPTNLVSDEDALRATQLRPHVGAPTQLAFTVRICASAKSAEQDVPLEAASDATVRDVKERIHARLLSGAEDGGKDCLNRWKGVGLPPDCSILLRYGAVLNDRACLQAARVQSGCFVQLFIVRPLPARVLRSKDDPPSASSSGAAGPVADL